MLDLSESTGFVIQVSSALCAHLLLLCRCNVAGGVQLQMLDLSESDWAAFGEQVKQLAEQQEKQAGKFQVGRQHMLLRRVRVAKPGVLCVWACELVCWMGSAAGKVFTPGCAQALHLLC
jgi:hypothetical protein